MSHHKNLCREYTTVTKMPRKRREDISRAADKLKMHEALNLS